MCCSKYTNVAECPLLVERSVTYRWRLLLLLLSIKWKPNSNTGDFSIYINKSVLMKQSSGNQLFWLKISRKRGSPPELET